MVNSPSVLMMIGAFLLVLGPLVVLHELGHYLVGRLFGVRAEAFAVGFGKELAGWTDKRGTRWKLCALPLGGYVQFAGDMNAASVPDPALADASREELRGTFQGAKLWQRSLIVLAGPLMNLFVAVAIFAAFNMAYGVPTASPEVGGFSDNSPAKVAGLKEGDKIVAIDGDRIETFFDIAERVTLNPGKTVTVTYERAGREASVPITLLTDVQYDQFGNELRRGLLGVRSAGMKFEEVGPVGAVASGFDQSLGIVRTMVEGLRQIITGERSVEELGGPIKIAKYSGEQFSLGWAAFVGFAGHCGSRQLANSQIPQLNSRRYLLCWLAKSNHANCRLTAKACLTGYTLNYVSPLMRNAVAFLGYVVSICLLGQFPLESGL